MDQLFYPKSVVVIGVSESPDNLARTIVGNLLEFQYQGKIHLLGRKRRDPLWKKDSHLPR